MHGKIFLEYEKNVQHCWQFGSLIFWIWAYFIPETRTVLSTRYLRFYYSTSYKPYTYFKTAVIYILRIHKTYFLNAPNASMKVQYWKSRPLDRCEWIKKYNAAEYEINFHLTYVFFLKDNIKVYYYFLLNSNINSS